MKFFFSFLCNQLLIFFSSLLDGRYQDEVHFLNEIEYEIIDFAEIWFYLINEK